MNLKHNKCQEKKKHNLWHTHSQIQQHHIQFTISTNKSNSVMESSATTRTKVQGMQPFPQKTITCNQQCTLL